ncbi:hypothetical protein ZIOFF_020960 [Zingiber officinale]|uniref:LOB domain-containing protein n=1 Tax=Zingiber officinale TaxID=94328 RepID=A0A8J5LLP5_ZINOF|nr:hypothetical protein ZIOFF_020960 [Zingiber officinale]
MIDAPVDAYATTAAAAMPPQFSYSRDGSRSKACAACRFQNQKCKKDCLLAPFFPASEDSKFQKARHLFGVSKMQKILKGLLPEQRAVGMATMIYEAEGTHMPARFWGEAVRHAVYLLNRLPTKALGDRTPFEAWMGRKPHLAHLRVFGCIAYVKNTTPHLKKLDDRSSPMVYLGVKEDCKAHRLFDPRHGKLQVSRDVVFQENSEWTWTAGANHEENLPEFMVEDALDTDEVIVVADIEAGTEDVAPPATAVKQKTVALSSCEAEFMAATTAACHALWLRSLTSELTGEKPKPTSSSSYTVRSSAEPVILPSSDSIVAPPAPNLDTIGTGDGGIIPPPLH